MSSRSLKVKKYEQRVKEKKKLENSLKDKTLYRAFFEDDIMKYYMVNRTNKLLVCNKEVMWRLNNEPLHIASEKYLIAIEVFDFRFWLRDSYGIDLYIGSGIDDFKIKDQQKFEILKQKFKFLYCKAEEVKNKDTQLSILRKFNRKLRQEYEKI